ncbi:uncharacterized protein TNIN_434341 [Trichonephila inaurata madagascariensis]|uniref:Uncharacterized protein n=1 Tax=Trichonephila inaurata madagascariensis TaxID=2747483 RepID=A0A8X6JDY7_9ARAC|nr:uncharacterized protein TNIN_434341 [Trichonephila inaurata madagascariensis]
MKRSTDDKWKTFIKSEISKTNIPLTLVKEIIVLMKPLALEIHNWMVDHNGIFTEEQEHSLEFCFNPDGTLNRVKTAELLIYSKRLDVQTRFVLACQYWSSSDIGNFFVYLPRSSKEQILRKYLVANENWNEHEVNVRQWINLYNFEPQSRDWPDILQNCTDVSLQSRLLDYYSEEARKSLLDIVFEYTEKMHVGRFCVSRMSVDHREKLLTSFPLKVLRVYLFRPYHHFFLDAANKVWNHLPGNHFTCLLHIIICQKILAFWEDYDYVNLLRQFWYSSPKHLKQFVERTEIFKILMEIVELGFSQKELPRYFALHDKYVHDNAVLCEDIIEESIKMNKFSF